MKEQEGGLVIRDLGGEVGVFPTGDQGEGVMEETTEEWLIGALMVEGEAVRRAIQAEVGQGKGEEGMYSRR